jgi:hypothetical protein
MSTLQASRVLVLGTCLVMGASAAFAQDPAVLKFTVAQFGHDDQEREPISGATVTILRMDGRAVATLLTDSAGRATTTAPTGNYDGIASASGHISTRFSVIAVPGEAVLTLMLSRLADEAMFPSADPPAPQLRGAISGRVLTTQGEPVSNTNVTFIADASSTQQSAWTADDGSFSVTLPLLASANPSDVRVQVRGTGGPVSTTTSVVYLPNAIEYSSRVRVYAGYETSGLELRVNTHPAFFLRVTARDVAGDVPLGTKISISATSTTGHESLAGTLQAEADGTVTFGPLQPGPVTLWAVANRTGLHLAAFTQIEVATRDADVVSLLLLPAARLKGRVEFAGLSRLLRGGFPLRVVAHAAESLGYHADDPNGMVQMDGSFVLDGLMGERCLKLLNVGHGWSLQSITAGGYDVTNVPLVLESGQEIGDVVFRVTPDDPFPPAPQACKGR